MILLGTAIAVTIVIVVARDLTAHPPKFFKRPTLPEANYRGTL